jgi:hypothetical protein
MGNEITFPNPLDSGKTVLKKRSLKCFCNGRGRLAA